MEEEGLLGPQEISNKAGAVAGLGVSEQMASPEAHGDPPTFLAAVAFDASSLGPSPRQKRETCSYRRRMEQEGPEVQRVRTTMTVADMY